MIHICFGLHDEDGKYSRYVGTAICSILENTDAPVTVHILHDGSLSKNNYRYFCHLIESYHQQIFFYEDGMDGFIRQVKQVDYYSIGTMMKLKMAEALPDSVERLIYLDADVVVNMDIAELWNESMGDRLVMGRKDGKTAIKQMCEQGILSYDSYINAGVLLLNLKAIRQTHDLYAEALNFFAKYPEADYVDQDAINFIFQGKVGFFDETYNLFTKLLRRENLNQLEKGIYHFAGDFPCDAGTFIVDRLFWHYFLMTPWGNEEAILTHYADKARQIEKLVAAKDKLCFSYGEEHCCNDVSNIKIPIIADMALRIRIFQRLMQNCMVRKVFWGTTGRIHQAVMKLFVIHAGDYYVDNNIAVWKSWIDGMPVKNPITLLQENHAQVMIIITTLRYGEVKAQLESYGYVENTNFFDGRLLLSVEDGGYTSAEQGNRQVDEQVKRKDEQLEQSIHELLWHHRI